MPTFPATRRTFLDAEVRNESAAVAGLLRGLAQWQNTTYARDLRVTPCDPAIYLSGVWDYNSDYTTEETWCPFVPGSYNLAEIFIPDPRGPFRQIRFWLYCELDTSVSQKRVDFLNKDTGKVTSATITYAALGSSLTGWLSVDVDAAAMQTIRVSGTMIAGPGVWTWGLSGYWIPPDIGGVSQVPIGGIFTAPIAGNDTPYSSLLLRSLSRASNALWYGRPLQVISKWWGGYGSGTLYDWSAWPRTIARYKVWIGAGVSSVSIGLRTVSSASGSMTVAIASLSASASIAVPINYGTVTGTLSFTAPASGGVHEVTVSVDGNPDFMEARGILIYESGTTLPESPPTDFTIIADESISGRASITASVVSSLAANMRWLWAYRRLRVLVSDSMFTPEWGYTFNGMDGTGNMAAAHRMPLSRAAISTGTQAAPLMIRQGANITGIYYGGTYTGGALTTYRAGSAEAAWAPQLIAPNASAGAGVTWDGHAQLHWQHRQSVYYTPESAVELVTYQSTSGYSTHHAWTILEEMPIGTPFLIGAP